MKSTQINKFIFPHYQYNGKNKDSVEKIMINSTLQEFGQKIDYIIQLQTGGSISQKRAYKEIKKLYHKMKESYKSIKEQNLYT